MPNDTVPALCVLPSPELRRVLIQRTDRLLLSLIRANVNSQYASQTPALADFRGAIASHGTGDNASLLESFRRLVPISDYDSYEPFIAKFDRHPCLESEVKDLLAPGLPYFLGLSSSTSGKAPKRFAKYHHVPKELPPGPPNPMFQPPMGTMAWVYFFGCKELKHVEGDDGRLTKVPVCQATNGAFRMYFGWSVDDDDSRMSTTIPGHTAPWAASFVNQHQSFLLLHVLFALIDPGLERICICFGNAFTDMIRLADVNWDMLLTCIHNGAVPDLDGIAHVRPHLAAQLRAHPERAAELREIGPPSFCSGWAGRVWPNLNLVSTICSGIFATALPKIRSIVGPNVALVSVGYGSTECSIGGPFDDGELDKFVLLAEDVVEFLDVTAENILQAWDLEVGKLYELVLTTRDGLWRYALGDIIEIVGFLPDSGHPVFKVSGRKSLAMRFPPAPPISDAHLVEAIRAINNPDMVPVQEFTTVVDERELPPTVGFFVEVAGVLGPNAHLAAERIFEVFVSINPAHKTALARQAIRLPTIRLVKPDTFMEYRHWKAEQTRVGLGQIKVPGVIKDEGVREWIQERVVQEL